MITQTSVSTLRSAAERLVVAATMGPTIDEVHAWRFKTRPGVVDVHADPARFRTKEDPTGREVHLGCGAALVNLRVAAVQLGREPVLRLLPEPGLPTWLATLRLSGPHRTTPFERLLYAATMRPFPACRPPAVGHPSEPVINELAEAARLEGARLRRIPGSQAEATAILSTPGDSAAEWLRAGQALQRVMLHAAVRMVSVSFRHGVINDSAASVALENGDVPQVLITMRRAIPAGGHER